MADITYFDAGYVDDNYFVYTANAQVQLALYLDHNYLAVDYFTDQNASVTLTCTAERIRFVLVSANLVSALALAVINTRDRRTSVTLETKANLVSAVVRVRDHTASFTANSQHQIQYQRTRLILVNFDSTVAQLSIAARNARGLIVMESRVTMTAIMGVIRQFEPRIISGLQLPFVGTPLSSAAGPIAGRDGLIFVDPAPGSIAASTISVWLRRDPAFGVTPHIQTSDGFISTQGTTVVVGDAGFAQIFTITWVNAFPADTDWHHVFLEHGNLGSFFGDGYTLYVDGVDQGFREFQSVSAGLLTYSAPQSSLYPFVQRNGLGAIAQFRVGSGSIDDVTIDDVYQDGLVDLGPLGRGLLNQHPLPKLYAELNSPWSNIHIQHDGYQPQFYRASTLPLTLPNFISPVQLLVIANAVIITTAQIVSNTQITVPTLRTRLFEAAITGSTVVTVTEERTREHIVSITADVTISAQGTRQQPGASAVASEVTVICDTTRIQPMQATLVTDSDLTCAAGEITQGQIDIDTTVSVLVVMTRIFAVAAQVTANTTVTPLVNAQFDHTANMSADTVATTDTARLRDNIIELDTDCVLVCDSVVFEGVDAVFTVQSVVTCETQVVKVTAVPLASEFTQISAGIKVVDMQANLVMQGFALTVVTVINIATELQILVPQETRQRQVTPESRQFAVPQDTRTRVIARETRLLQVNPQSGVNIV